MSDSNKSFPSSSGAPIQEVHKRIAFRALSPISHKQGRYFGGGLSLSVVKGSKNGAVSWLDHANESFLCFSQSKAKQRHIHLRFSRPIRPQSESFSSQQRHDSFSQSQEKQERFVSCETSLRRRALDLGTARPSFHPLSPLISSFLFAHSRSFPRVSTPLIRHLYTN